MQGFCPFWEPLKSLQVVHPITPESRVSMQCMTPDTGWEKLVFPLNESSLLNHLMQVVCSSVLLETKLESESFETCIGCLLLQPLRWRCVDCVIHHERDVREEQKYMYVARINNNRVISSGDLYCCLLPRFEALRTCRSGFPIATKWCCDQDVKVVPGSAFTRRTCDRCGSLHWLCDSSWTGCARRTKIYVCGANKQ